MKVIINYNLLNAIEAAQQELKQIEYDQEQACIAKEQEKKALSQAAALANLRVYCGVARAEASGKWLVPGFVAVELLAILSAIAIFAAIIMPRL